MYTVFMHYKRDEWERFCATVTDWDVNEYLDVLPDRPLQMNGRPTTTQDEPNGEETTCAESQESSTRTVSIRSGRR